MIKVPYSPVLSDSLTMEDDAACQTQSRVSAAAVQNARLDLSLESQLNTWDDFMSSEKAEKYDRADLLLHRELIIVAWNIAEKYPDVTPKQYGEYVYASCAADKQNNAVEF